MKWTNVAHPERSRGTRQRPSASLDVVYPERRRRRRRRARDERRKGRRLFL